MEKKEKLALFLAAVLILILASFGVYNLLEFKTVQGKVIYSRIEIYQQGKDKDTVRLDLVRIKDDRGRKYDVAGWLVAGWLKTELKEGQIVEVIFARFKTVWSGHISFAHLNPDGTFETIYGENHVNSAGEIQGTSEYVRYKRIVSYRIIKNVP